MRDDVVKFVADFTGAEVSQIDLNTKVNDDLGVDGDDGIEFLEEFSQRFDVNLTGINKKYFGPEGFNPLTIIFTLIKEFVDGFTGKPDTYSPLSVQHLVESAEKGKWTDI